ncbi:GH116 family glycosyl-hydrolase [Streptomyces mirabilis]|nr:GH116 family glycosyl-hydrolase [Streptomyces mirabilis]
MKRAIPTRRTLMRAALGAVPASFALTAAPRAVAGPSASGGIGAGGRASGFVIPEPALSRPLGRIAHGVCDPSVSQVCDGSQPQGPIEALKGAYPMSVPGLGIPLGGVGAGSFMINQSGTFGPWNFGGGQNGDRWQNRILPQAAFHFRERIGNGPATVRTLATPGPRNTGSLGTVADRSWGDPLPAWTLLKAGDGTYNALYPFGWIDYSAFETDVSLRFYSPIVAGEDRRTSLPVAYFDVRLTNRSSQVADVSVMFTMPNAPGNVGGTPATVRKGLAGRVTTDRSTGVTGVTLSSDDPSNTADAFKSEWTIAARPAKGQKVTYTTSWNGDGDGSDVYKPFQKNGALGNARLDDSASAGAIAVQARLEPGGSTVIPFVLTWDFPQITYADNKTVWMRRYTNFYGARTTDRTNATAGGYNAYISGSYPFHQSFAIANDALGDRENNLRAVHSWWKAIAGNTAYPKLLRTAALNQLSQVAFKMPLWEGGFVSSTSTPTGGTRAGSMTPGTHLYWSPDSAAGGNNGMGSDVGSYGYMAYSYLFPSIERDRLRAVAETVMLDQYGNPGDPDVNNPWITLAKGTEPTPDNQEFIDRPAKRLYRMYAHARFHGDWDFLESVYPAMKRMMAFLQALVRPDEYLPRTRPTPEGAMLPAMPNTYNSIPGLGRDVYNSGLYLLALAIMIKAGRRTGEDKATVTAWQRAFDRARTEFEDVFWDGTNQWYRYTEYTKGSATHLDTFYAQHVAERLGLPDLVNLRRYRTQLTQHYARFTADRTADGRLLGARTMVLPDGVTEWPALSSILGVAAPRQEVAVFTGTNYFAAATYLLAGARFHDTDLREHGVEMASAVSTQIWSEDENGFAFDAPEAYGPSNAAVYSYPAYERVLAVWDTLDAIESLATVLPSAHRM